jgi:hypothetical protein
MSTDFDPYYLWLGIPPQEQPPNHYRLLGIAAFESNASVIDSAASRQSTYLHSVAAGPQRQASQKLLTEIAGARRTLLNAESKQIYDAELKARLASVAPKVAPPVARPVTAQVVAPITAPVIAPVAAPIAAPVITPLAVPVAAPVAAPVTPPVAAPIAPPIAAPEVAPLTDPFAGIAAPAEPEPTANLFGDFAEESSPAVESAPASVPSVPASPPPAAGTPAAPRSTKRPMWLVGGGVGLLLLILGAVFWPKRAREEAPAQAPKKSTAKKSKAPPSEDDNSAQPAARAVESANIPRNIRFIRIELPRKGVLSLAEVETIYDNRNVAAYGATAEQSSTEGAAAAGLAVDGKTSGNAGDRSLAQTKDTDRPWWKLDLGGAYPLEKIVIHNATDPGAGERMAGFTLLLMNHFGQTVVELKDQPAPNPRSEFIVKSLPLANATPAPAKPKPRKKS